MPDSHRSLEERRKEKNKNGEEGKEKKRRDEEEEVISEDVWGLGDDVVAVMVSTSYDICLGT